MATLTEASVVAQIYLLKDAEGTKVFVSATSYTADGIPIRSMSQEVYSQLSAARQNNVEDLLTNLTNRAKSIWNIP